MKDEPEDLTGRHRDTKTHQDAMQRTSDAHTTGESGSESDSDLCIDEQVCKAVQSDIVFHCGTFKIIFFLLFSNEQQEQVVLLRERQFPQTF